MTRRSTLLDISRLNPGRQAFVEEVSLALPGCARVSRWPARGHRSANQVPRVVCRQTEPCSISYPEPAR
jgi:hypothetical protein